MLFHLKVQHCTTSFSPAWHIPLPSHHYPGHTSNVPSVLELFLVTISHFGTPVVMLSPKHFWALLQHIHSFHEQPQLKPLSTVQKTLISGLIELSLATVGYFGILLSTSFLDSCWICSWSVDRYNSVNCFSIIFAFAKGPVYIRGGRPLNAALW